MPKVCDQTSVGAIIPDDVDKIVMIKRLNYPQAYALPAGHCDGDTPGLAINREVHEEVGLDISILETFFEGWLDNPCKREGGIKHCWEVYFVYGWNGKLKVGSDAKEAFWAPPSAVKAMAMRTEYFIRKYSGGRLSKDVEDRSVPFELVAQDGFGSGGDKFTMSVGTLTRAIFGDPQSGGQDVDPEWKEGMGLEPVWYYLLKQMHFI